MKEPLEAAPVIFLVGPPGAGKSSLGRAACEGLGLEFRDLGTESGDVDAALERITALVNDREADVMEVPWSLQEERKTLPLLRVLGLPLVLWAHPEQMQARSGSEVPVCTPSPRLKVRGGFGRTGKACPEFRRLDRACEYVLDLNDATLDEAVETLKEVLEALREPDVASTPTEREGLEYWVDSWRSEYGSDRRATEILVDAMARYLEHLRAAGQSPRSISGVVSDLQAAGILVMSYDAPRGKRALLEFYGPPHEIEFRRKFSDSKVLTARYRRNLQNFSDFLRANGEIPD